MAESTSARSLYVEAEISPEYVRVRSIDGGSKRERVMKKTSVLSNYRMHRPEDNGRATRREPVAKAASGKKQMHPADIRRADHLIVETLEEPVGAPPEPARVRDRSVSRSGPESVEALARLGGYLIVKDGGARIGGVDPRTLPPGLIEKIRMDRDEIEDLFFSMGGIWLRAEVDGRRFVVNDQKFDGLITAALRVVDVWVGMNVGSSFPDGSSPRVIVDVGELRKIDGAISTLTDSIGDSEL